MEPWSLGPGKSMPRHALPWSPPGGAPRESSAGKKFVRSIRDTVKLLSRPKRFAIFEYSKTNCFIIQMSIVPYVGRVSNWNPGTNLSTYVGRTVGGYIASQAAGYLGRKVGEYAYSGANRVVRAVASRIKKNTQAYFNRNKTSVPSNNRRNRMPKRKMSFGPLIGGYKKYKPRAVAIVPVRNRGPRYIKGAIAPYGGRRELKFVDTALSSLALDTTGTVTALNLIAVGDDNTSRDGRQVTIKSCQIKGFASPPDLTTDGPNKSRVLLVWDNAVNSGTIAAIGDILVSANANSFPLINNANRFTIMWDSSWEFNCYQTTATQAAVSTASKSVEYYTKINKIVQYSGTTAAIGSIQNGGLLLVTCGTAAAASAQILNGGVRVRFTDD